MELRKLDEALFCCNVMGREQVVREQSIVRSRVRLGHVGTHDTVSDRHGDC